MTANGADSAGAQAYDPDNIFAKILDGKIPCNKVYESRNVLAVLDAFPMVEGHVLVIPKHRGAVDFLDMPPAKAADIARDLQKVARAVKQATGCAAVNIWNNNGEDAGQTVPHPHFHIVPRFKDDKLHTYPASAKEMLSKEAAAPMIEKLQTALNPPTPLKKAEFKGVNTIKPDAKGLNLTLRVVEDVKEVTSKNGRATFFEVLCGDPSGTVILSLKDAQKDLAAKGKTLTVRNAGSKMIDGHLRLVVDKWGKLEASATDLEGEVDMSDKKNVSATEYELVDH